MPISGSRTPAQVSELEIQGADQTRLYARLRPGPEHGKESESSQLTAVLTDGILCDGFIYKYLWNDLAEITAVAHWHYRGHGRSSAPRDGDGIGVEVMEAAKLVIGAGETLNGRLLLLDAKLSEWRTVRVKRDPACAICSVR